MNLGIYPANKSLTFGAGKNINQKMSSIDIAYAKELAEIKARKQDEKIAYLLNPSTPFQKAKDKIQNALQKILDKKS